MLGLAEAIKGEMERTAKEDLTILRRRIAETEAYLAELREHERELLDVEDRRLTYTPTDTPEFDRVLDDVADAQIELDTDPGPSLCDPRLEIELQALHDDIIQTLRPG